MFNLSMCHNLVTVKSGGITNDLRVNPRSSLLASPLDKKVMPPFQMSIQKPRPSDRPAVMRMTMCLNMKRKYENILISDLSEQNPFMLFPFVSDSRVTNGSAWKQKAETSFLLLHAVN